MTVLFVLATLILFLTADHFVQLSRTRKASKQVTERLLALGQAFQPVPDGVRLQANHTWTKDDPHGTVTIGLDEFMAKFLGAVESIAIPTSGTAVNPATAGIMLEDGGKAIRLASPMTGKVILVNHDVMRSPALAAMDPYGKGWLMKIQTEKKSEGMIGAQATQWLRDQTAAARDFFSVREGQGVLAYAQDGGEPVAGLMKQFNATAWREFEAEFLVLQGGAADRASISSNQ